MPTACFTSFFGGNLVDGLPPAFIEKAGAGWLESGGCRGGGARARMAGAGVIGAEVVAEDRVRGSTVGQ